jgi:tetratricopeptide (TPR) repeat protein
MTAEVVDRDRKVIPRWRKSSIAAGTGELRSLRGGAPTDHGNGGSQEVAARAQLFKLSPTPGLAGDLVGAALVNGLPDLAHEAAREIMRQSQPRYRLAQRVGGAILGISPAMEEPLGTADLGAITTRSIVQIHRLRSLLSIQPRNALAWCDLSLAYTMLAQADQARHAMQNALWIAPEDRLVLRSATRMFIHSGEPDTASALLARSEGIGRDPWLMAAEISAAALADRPSVSLGRSRRLVDRDGLEPWHLSELAAALATSELEAGNRRKARKLFRQALRNPTENAVAQVEWAHEYGLGQEWEGSIALPEAHEARARLFVERGDWESALEAALKWLLDQLFSRDAAGYASWVAASGLEDYQTAIAVARIGLAANPDDPILRNNLVFALASSDMVEEADRELELLHIDELAGTDLAVVTATRGLIAYRRGNEELGRDLYTSAISSASGPDAERIRATAALLMLREELRAGSLDLTVLVESLAPEFVGSRHPEVLRLRNGLSAELGVSPVSNSESGPVAL